MPEEKPMQYAFRAKVLVVDDEKRIRDGCETMLCEEGLEVVTAASGDQGLALIAREHFDIVLLDLMMAGLSGMEVLPRLKRLHPDTVTIVITGYATLDHAVEAMKKGAFDFIPKPFAPRDLRLVVAKAIHYLHNLQDIATEQSRMRVLINHLADGVMATDCEGNLALANPAFLKMLRCDGETVIGRHYADIITDADLKAMIAESLGMPPGELAELNRELNPSSGPQGDEIILGARCVPFRDRMDRNLGTITVLHDITALKKVDKLRSDFVSMVAHEIHSPLNTVLMQLKIILDGLAGAVSTKQTEILGRASGKLKALTTLSAQLLDLAHIETSLITLEKERLDLGALAAEQVRFHRAQAEQAAIRLEMAMPPDLPPVLANHDKLQVVLANLITNALKYTPREGRVRLTAGVEEGYVRVSVGDTGLGIAPEDQEMIFQRFYRVRNEKTRKIGGTGLGLAIVKSIVDAHNGRIRVESEPGQGSVFHVCFPLGTS